MAKHLLAIDISEINLKVFVGEPFSLVSLGLDTICTHKNILGLVETN